MDISNQIIINLTADDVRSALLAYAIRTATIDWQEIQKISATDILYCEPFHYKIRLYKENGDKDVLKKTIYERLQQELGKLEAD